MDEMPNEEGIIIAVPLSNGYGGKHASLNDTERTGYHEFSQGSSQNLITIDDESARNHRRWKDIAMSFSFLYAISLAMLTFALKMASVLQGDVINSTDMNYFFVILYGISCIMIVIFMAMGATNRLTSDHHYKNQHSVVFVLAGALVLGTGGILYNSLNLTQLVTDSDCLTTSDAVFSLFAIIYVFLEIILLLSYTKIRVNKNLKVEIASRFMLMHIVGTNIATWIFTIILESEHESHSDDHGDHDDHSHDAGVTSTSNNTEEEGCQERSSLSSLIAPYTFPLLIEFCVVASTLALSIWEKVGEENHHESTSSRKANKSKLLHPSIISRSSESNLHLRHRNNSASLDSITTNENTTMHQHHEEEYVQPHNTHVGFLIGWVLITVAVVTIIVYSYMIYSDTGYTKGLEQTIYSINLAICVVCLIVIPVTAKQMSVLTTKDREIKIARKTREDRKHHHKKSLTRTVDKNLLTQTFIALMTFEFLIMISALDQNSSVMFCAALFELIFGFVQTVFINWFAFPKRTTKEGHFQSKPGRQGLELLRAANMALWLVNTFLLENTEAKQVHWDTYGKAAWIIMSNVFQPLTILYHFHAMVCYAEVLNHTYSKKYVGLLRPSKQISSEATSATDEGFY